MEMVLLFKSANWWRRHGFHCFLPQDPQARYSKSLLEGEAVTTGLLRHNTSGGWSCLSHIGASVGRPDTCCKPGGPLFSTTIDILQWSSGRVVACLVLMAVLLISFVAVQVFLPNTATLPLRIFSQRSIISGFWQTLCVGSGNYIFGIKAPRHEALSSLLTSITVYFLPIWFQSIKGSSAMESGIRLLPMMISMVVGSIGGGITNSKIGYYTPLAIIGSCIMSVGAGLLTTFQVDTSEGKWIGYQIVYGIGLGLCFQVPNLAAQTVLPKPDVPSGLALMLFGQMIGAAVFVSVGENILANQLVKRLSGIPGFNSNLVTSGGVTELLDTMPSDLHDTVFHSYNDALRNVFQLGMIISCLTVLGAATLEWKSIKKGQPNPDAENKGQGGEKSVQGAGGK